MDEKAIGANIRTLREKAGRTLTAVAAEARLTKSTLSKIEKGVTSPPISTLVRIAGAMGVELASFFVNPGPRPSCVYTPRGKGSILTRDGSRFGYAYEALALDMPGKAAEPFVLTIQPGDPLGRFEHTGQEFVYMLAGAMTFTVAQEVFTLKKGDSLYFNAQQPHTTQVTGKLPARFVCLFINTDAASLPSPAPSPSRSHRAASAVIPRKKTRRKRA